MNINIMSNLLRHLPVKYILIQGVHCKYIYWSQEFYNYTSYLLYHFHNLSHLCTSYIFIYRVSSSQATVKSKSHAKTVWGPKVLREILQVPKLSSHGIYIPNGCKHFKVFLQFINGSEANKLLKNEKISGIERLVLPFPDT